MRRLSKFLAILIVIALLFPTIVQAAPESNISSNTSLVKEASNESVKRLSGKDRLFTSLKVSQEVYEKSDSVVLAGYNGQVDALAGTLLAASKNAPLLYTYKNKISPELIEELERLEVKTVYILGGEAVVDEKVENELKKNYTVIRIKGSNREMTAVEVAKEANIESKHVFLANGYDGLSDALTIGPVSALKGMPLLLTRMNKLSPATLEVMKELGVTHVTIIGGEAAVSEAVENKLKEEGFEVDRVKGSNREETALAIARKYFAAPKKAVIANGYVYADASVGGYLAALNNAPILLTNTDKISSNTTDYIKDYTENAYVLGGDAVVSEEVFNIIKECVEREKLKQVTFDVLRTAINPGYYFSGIVIDMGTTVKSEDIDKDTFAAKARVTEYNGEVQEGFGSFAWDPEKEDYALGDGWAKWNILDAYVVDADGNKVDEGQYVKIDIEWGTRTEPDGSQANRYDVPATRAAWYTSGTGFSSFISYATVEVELTQLKDIPGIGRVAYVQGETRHDPLFEKFEIKDAPGGGKYALYEPENASEDNKRPLFIWFHGTGERYHGENPGGNLIGNRVLAFVEDEFQTALGGCYVLAPQSTTSGWGPARLDDMEQLINSIIEEYHVDPDRVIVGGLSMGTGMTTPLILSQTENKIDFAAAILCSGGNINEEQAQILAEKGIAMYLVGNTSDFAASGLNSAYENLKAAGVDVKLKMYPEGPVYDGEYYYGAHDSWNYIYNNLVKDEEGETIFEWIAKQKREEIVDDNEEDDDEGNVDDNEEGDVGDNEEDNGGDDQEGNVGDNDQGNVDDNEEGNVGNDGEENEEDGIEDDTGEGTGEGNGEDIAALLERYRVLVA